MKYRLMTPGPTSVPPEVLAALAEPVTHHRTPEFRATLGQLQQDLRWIFQTQQPVCTLTASGTAGLEAALVSVLKRGSRVLSIDSGRFARRWGSIARQFGLDVIEAHFEPGSHVTPAAMGSLLDDRDFDAVLITHSETSTATACDLEAITRTIRQQAPSALVMVDAITSIGAIPFFMDGWGIDVAVTGCQKALMVPPGLSYVALSERAWSAAERNADAPVFYLDLRKYRESGRRDDTPFTPAIPLIKAQAVALRMLREEGLEEIWRRTRVHAQVTRAGMTAMGVAVASRMPADSVTALRYPPGVDDAFRKTLAARHNIHVAGGQDELAGKIFRVNHMGFTDIDDALAVVAATEAVLSSLGHHVVEGESLAAAREAAAAPVTEPTT